MLPDSLIIHLKEELGEEVKSASRVSGGSINEAAQISFAGTGICFLKWNRTADPDMFAKEVKGLEVLENADTGLTIPSAIAHGTDGNGTGYLLMEFIEEGTRGQNSDRSFGTRLAHLHGITGEYFGLDHDNYIGRLPQSNTEHADWTSFFIEERMEPQLERALEAGRLSPGIRDVFQKMYRRLPGIFPEEPAGLLHGDLWGGNYFYDTGGNATLYDPAVYYGHREIELAFTHLFGGFSSGFYDAYEKTYPVSPGFKERKNIYNLYPLLVHTNLFGGHYGRQVESIANRFA